MRQEMIRDDTVFVVSFLNDFDIVYHTFSLRPVAIRGVGLRCVITVFAVIPAGNGAIADTLSLFPTDEESLIGCQHRHFDREHRATGGIQVNRHFFQKNPAGLTESDSPDLTSLQKVCRMSLTLT